MSKKEPSPDRTEVAAAALQLVNDAVAKAKATTGWMSHSLGSFVREVLIQAEMTLKTYEAVSAPSAHALRFMIEQLRVARRIRIGVPLVPSSARLAVPATMQAHSLGLVYSSAEPLAIEYEHAGVYDAAADLTHALSTRRLALVIPMQSEFAFDTQSLAGFERAQTDHGAVMVWSINYFEEKKEWEFAPTAAIIARFPAISYMKARMGALTRAERIARKLSDRLGELRKSSRAGQSGAEALGDPIPVQYQDMLPELIRQLASDQMRQISRELSMDACWAALGTMNALACGNVDLQLLQGAADGAEHPMMNGADGVGSANAVPVDPFHGSVECTWAGNWRWMQGLRQGLLEPGASKKLH